MDNLIFGLYDVLVKGKLKKDIDLTYFDELVSYFKEKNISFYLVTGLKKEKCEKLVSEFKLDAYFDKDKIIFIDDKYLESLSEIDRDLRDKHFKEDEFYSDDYHKVYFINNSKELNTGNTLFIGHDLWTDALYISRYTKANVVLLKDTLSYNKEEYKGDLKTIYTVESNFKSFKDFLESEKMFNYSALSNFAHKKIYGQMVGQLNFGNVDFGKVLEKYAKSKKNINEEDVSLDKESKDNISEEK